MNSTCWLRAHVLLGAASNCAQSAKATSLINGDIPCMIVSMADGLRYAVYVSLSRQTCTAKVRCLLMAVRKGSSDIIGLRVVDVSAAFMIILSFLLKSSTSKNVIGLGTPVLRIVVFDILRCFFLYTFADIRCTLHYIR